MNEFKPDYLCDNEKCRQVTMDIVDEYQSEIKRLNELLAKEKKYRRNEKANAKREHKNLWSRYDELEKKFENYRGALNVCMFGWASCGDNYQFKGLGQYEYLQGVLMPDDYPHLVRKG